MTTSYAALGASTPPVTRASTVARTPAPTAKMGSWRYECRRSSRAMLIFAAITSAVLHGALFINFGHTRKKAAPPRHEEFLIAVVPMSQIKDLDEPEPPPTDDLGPPPDPGVLVPMQQDLPQVPRPSDFVQQVNIASLVQPDFTQAKVFAIPETRATGRIGEGIGKIFNLADLDRQPEAIFQPPPIYPAALRNEGLTATVNVEFVVDVNGVVIRAFAVESTRRGFEDAAVAGVSRWKFRPGIKGGRKVNTRMMVPIIFRVLEDK